MINEMYMTIVSYVWQAADMLIWVYCFYRFTVFFMENKRGALYAGATYFTVQLLLYLLPFSLQLTLISNYFLVEGIANLAAVFALYRIERTNCEHKIFLGVTFFALGWLVYTMADVLYDNLYRYATETRYMQTHLNMWFVLWVVMSVLHYLLWFAFMILAIRCIVKAYARQSLEMTKKELLMLTIPSFSGVAGYILISRYRVFYILEGGAYYPMYDAFVFLYCAVSVITIMVVIVQYRNIKSKQEERVQNELLNAQIDSIRQHVEQAENLYRDIRSIRHDMTNHLFTLEKLYEENETEEARAYSEQLKEMLNRMTGEIKSGNPVTDIILQEVRDRAEKQGISFCSKFYYPADSKVNAFDISVILHNALQNALENTKSSEKAYIFIRSYQKKNAYIIEVKNSYRETLQWNTQNGLPYTTKEKTDTQGYGENHGYGLSNIRAVAKKYCGDVDIAATDGVFLLSVMLMI